MECETKKLAVLAYLLTRYGEAVEADLFPDVDLLDLWRDDRPLTIRRVWVLVRHRLLVDGASGPMPIQGTALARCILGELGDWSRLDLMTAASLGVKPPKTRAENEWRVAQQSRLKRIQESQQATMTAPWSDG